MKKYEYFLFDWDGNLAKTIDIWLDAVRFFAKKEGLKVSSDEIANSLGNFNESFANWGIKDVEKMIHDVDKLAKQKLPQAALYPDALEVLEKLKAKNKKLAIITASFRENVEEALIRHNIAHFFDAIITASDTKYRKPHPEPLEQALEHLGATYSKELAVMIGDTEKDVGAAINAGIDSVLFFPPEHHQFYNLDELVKQKPTYLIHDFRELLNAT